MKVRKRVTLMVITVSSIFGISWGTSSITYVLKHFTTRNTGHVAISTTMALLNSTVNPFLYALFNQPFVVKSRECCAVPFVLQTGFKLQGKLRVLSSLTELIIQPCNLARPEGERWPGTRSLKKISTYNHYHIVGTMTF